MAALITKAVPIMIGEHKTNPVIASAVSANLLSNNLQPRCFIGLFSTILTNAFAQKGDLACSKSTWSLNFYHQSQVKI